MKACDTPDNATYCIIHEYLECNSCPDVGSLNYVNWGCGILIGMLDCFGVALRYIYLRKHVANCSVEVIMYVIWFDNRDYPDVTVQGIA